MNINHNEHLAVETSEQADIRLNKDVAAFSYIWIMSLVVFFARKNSPFAQYHSKQGIVLFILSFVWILPFVGHLLTIIVVAGMVLGFIHAAQGKRLDVPFVGPISRGESNVGHIAEGILKAFEKGYATFLSHVKRKAPGSADKAAQASTTSTGVQ